MAVEATQGPCQSREREKLVGEAGVCAVQVCALGICLGLSSVIRNFHAEPTCGPHIVLEHHTD